jgi:hypothetical protein
MKLHSKYLNPFQSFPERQVDSQDDECLGPAIENNMSRAVFSALANAETSNVLATFVEHLAKNPRYGSDTLCNRLRHLAAVLRQTDPSKVEVGLQAWPADAVKERLGREVYLIGISSCGVWTHDQRSAPTEPRADAWIYVPEKMLLIFEFKNDEHSLDATQVSAYIHALGLPGVDDVPRAEPRSKLSDEQAQAVQEKCKNLVIDADWSAVMDAVKHTQKDESVGSLGCWLSGQAAAYIQLHVHPPYHGIQTILDWLNGPDTPDRRAHLRTLVEKMGDALMESAGGFSDAITFTSEDHRSGAGAALYKGLSQNEQP